MSGFDSASGCVGFMMDEVAGAGFAQVHQFPLLVLTPVNAPYLSVIGPWRNRPTSGCYTKWT